jgi:signal transduction histidine kinase
VGPRDDARSRRAALRSVLMERRFPTWVADGVIAVGLFLLSLGTLRQFDELGLTEQFGRAPDALGTLLIALQCLPLTFRRRFPVTVTLVVLVGFVVDRGLDYPSTLAWLATLVAIHAVGSELSARRSAVVGYGIIGVVTAYTLLGASLRDTIGIESALSTALAGVVALYLGREVHQGRERSRLAEERAESAERQREERARRAVADERARIARELHDVVAHQLALMTLQAEGAARLAATDDADPRVRQALTTISDAGREGLEEMRRMVGLLRAPADDDPLEPQPGLDRLPALAEHFEGSGLPVTVAVVGQPRRLPGGVELSAYRIVQESLTNALRHGGPDVHAEITVEYRPDAVDVTVTDDGRGVTAGGDASGGGHGIIGMRERAALLEGKLDAGPRTGGGFRVRAILPTTSTRPAATS